MDVWKIGCKYCTNGIFGSCHPYGDIFLRHDWLFLQQSIFHPSSNPNRKTTDTNGREFIKMQGNSKDEFQILVGSHLTPWVNFMICQNPRQFAFINHSLRSLFSVENYLSLRFQGVHWRLTAFHRITGARSARDAPEGDPLGGNHPVSLRYRPRGVWAKVPGMNRFLWPFFDYGEIIYRCASLHAETTSLKFRRYTFRRSRPW